MVSGCFFVPLAALAMRYVYLVINTQVGCFLKRNSWRTLFNSMIHWALFGLIVSPVPILAMLYWANNNQTWLVDQCKQLRSRILQLEHKLFRGRLIRLLSFMLAWAVPTLYAALFSGLTAYFYMTVHYRLVNPPTFLYNTLLFILAASFLLAVYTPPTRALPLTSTTPTWRHDNLVFFSTECSTCHINKPARSRHCRFCGGCVLLYDHHCIWLNNCVGLGNLLWFFVFLGMNIVVLTWASLIALPMAYVNYELGLDYSAEFGLGGICFLCDILVIWFLCVNLLLVKQGMTTNEHGKWQTIHELVKEGNLFETNGFYYEYLPNERLFVSANQQDSRVANVDRTKLNKVGSIKELTNIYDKGSFMDNLKERFMMTKYPTF